MHIQQRLNMKTLKPAKVLMEKMQAYWSLIKSKQTFLLVLTGWAGFGTVACSATKWKTVLPLLISLFLAISGCTAINMVMDRDLDNKMERTKRRPLPSGVLSAEKALVFGAFLSFFGVGGAFLLKPLFGWIVFIGFLANIIIYTLWLKRTSYLSIFFGGIAGGMPILAGRVLALGTVDLIGLLLSAAILFWIPIHIMTIQIKYQADYRKAGIPTFPEKYGEKTTRVVIALSTGLASLSIVLAAYLIEIKGYSLISLVLLSIALIILALVYVRRPSPQFDTGLFKAASVYMLGAMLILGVI